MELMNRKPQTDIICDLSFGFIPDFVNNPEEGRQLFNVLDIVLEGFWYSEYSHPAPHQELQNLAPHSHGI